MERRLLFDASSLLYILKLGKLKILSDNYVQWLTIYEALNALWKEAALVRSISLEKALKIVEILMRAVALMNCLSPHPYEDEVLVVAHKLGITAYDASYVVVAERNGLSLVTEDMKLKAKAEEMIKVFSMKDLI